MMIHEFKPETLDERKARKEKEENNRIFKNVSFQEVTTRIADLIFNSIYHNKIMINKENPKSIGNVMFWIEAGGETPALMYNIHPSKWNKDEVIIALEVEEYNLFKNKFYQ